VEHIHYAKTRELGAKELLAFGHNSKGNQISR
jgi:hypothetical protein